MKLNYFKTLNLFFFSPLTGENAFAKVKQLWSFHTLMSFVYLVSAWVIFAGLKILQEGNLKGDLLSNQHLDVLRYLGGKGIIQQRKQQKAMGQVCNSVNKLRHFQTAVC